MQLSPAVFALALSVLCLASLGASCSSPSQAHPRIAFASAAPPQRPAHLTGARVILVTLDGVRAADVFGGADPSLRPGAKVDRFRRPEAVMPRLHQLVATRGVALGADQKGCGVVRTASGMNVSQPGYLEIFTGRKTRCRDNQCAPTELPTVLDEAVAAGISPVASIGSWNILDRVVSAGPERRSTTEPGTGTFTGRGVFVAEGRERWPGPLPLVDAALAPLVEAGEQADAYPGDGMYRPDEHTMAIALQYFRTNLPPVFHVGLGDADEWGHRNDYVAYLEAIERSDAFIGKLADTLDELGDIGTRTTVIVTTDHGRNEDFRHHGSHSISAARTFVMAFGGNVPAAGVVCAKHDVTLVDIAPTVRTILGLAPDASLEAGRSIEEIVQGGGDAGAAGAIVAGASTAGMLQRP